MELKLSRSTIRPFRLTDAAAVAEMANNPKVWRNMRDRFPFPYTLADAEGWVGYASQQDPVTDFALEADGQAIGGIGFALQSDVHRLSAEIGYWLGEPYWGRGIATEALRAMTEHAFERFGLVRLFATVFEHNLASARVLEKAGYQREGLLRKSVIKGGQVLDSLLYACVRGG